MCNHNNKYPCNYFWRLGGKKEPFRWEKELKDSTNTIDTSYIYIHPQWCCDSGIGQCRHTTKVGSMDQCHFGLRPQWCWEIFNQKIDGLLSHLTVAEWPKRSYRIGVCIVFRLTWLGKYGLQAKKKNKEVAFGSFWLSNIICICWSGQRQQVF